MNGYSSGPFCTYNVTDGPGFLFVSSTDDSERMGQNMMAFAVVGGWASSYYNNSNHLWVDRWLMVNADDSYTAHACGLWFCVQAYNTSVISGIQTQTIVGNWSTIDDSSSSSTQDDYLKSPPINFTDVPQSLKALNNYTVNQYVMTAFGMNPIFIGGNASFGSDSVTFYEYSSNIIEGLKTVKDPTTWIEAFALSMSNNIRTGGHSFTPDSVYAGQVWTSLPYVHVRWPWLSFPAAMVTSSFIFLILCIWRTHHLRVYPWKADALALALASVDASIQHDLKHKHEAGKHEVRLDVVEGYAVFETTNL